MLQDVGLNVANILRRAELPADPLAEERAALSAEEYFRLWSGIGVARRLFQRI